MNTEIYLRVPEYDDPISDQCAPIFTNDRTVAVLEINGIRIPLSFDRVEDLISKVEEFKNTTFCYKCDYFIMSKSGWNYGGSCKLKGKRHDEDLNENNAGFIYCVDCMATCKDAIPKKT